MRFRKIHFAIDKTSRTKRYKNDLLTIYKSYLAKESDVIVVIGGDGFMLQTLKKYRKYNKPFYGMNMGSFGFLMNKFKIKNIKQNIYKAKQVLVSPLIMEAVTKNNKKKNCYCH